jgi:hypothetical protein
MTRTLVVKFACHVNEVDMEKLKPMALKPAAQRNIRRSSVATLLFLAIFYGVLWITRHYHLHGWKLYLLALLPAIPMAASLAYRARVQEWLDEFERLQSMRSFFAATVVLLGTLLVSDCMRAFAHVSALRPFVDLVIFSFTYLVAFFVQILRGRVSSDE